MLICESLQKLWTDKTEDVSAVVFYYKSIKPDKHNFPPFGKLLSM